MTEDETHLPHTEGIRINKYLASCGFESRRKADQLIADGAVEINGKRVEAPGARVMPGDYVKVNGKQALPKEEVSVLLNKPRGFVCSRDAQGADGTVYDLLPARYRFVNYVGRLDSDSEGLLILTNKGELCQRLSHPTGGIEKEYWVTLNQPYDNSVLVQMLKGVRIPEGQARAKYVSRLSPRRACVVLEQGLKRQVRQMFACLGFRVRKLVRVRIGSLWGGDLAPGRAMLLTPEQEKLATINPGPRKGLISAAQAFPSSGALSKEQLDSALDEKAARKALEEETDYVFNPSDFETEEEAAATSAYERDEQEHFRPKTQRRSFHEKKSFRDAPRRTGHTRYADARRTGRNAFTGRWREERENDERGRRRNFGGAQAARPYASRRDEGEGSPRRFHRNADARGGSFRNGPRRAKSFSHGGFEAREPRRESRRGGFGAPRRSSHPKRSHKRF